MKTKSAPNLYEAAIKWIEEEIHKNGIFEIKRAEVEIYNHKQKLFTRKPNGKLGGFTISSQHTPGNDLNILQLVNTMKNKIYDANN